MVTPDERRRILQAARDDQEEQANAADELARRQQEMTTFKADMNKQSAAMTNYHAQIAGYSTEVTISPPCNFLHANPSPENSWT